MSIFKVTANGSNRIDIELGGKLNADEMRIALDDLIDKSKDIHRGKMLYQITDFDFPTLAAIGVELARLPALFGLIGKFARVAVLADQTWIKKASELEGALFPGMEIKAFDLNERTAAEAWLIS